MVKRRTHSSIDKLPAGLRETITRMIVDNEWPPDFAGEHTGKPRYEDVVLYCVTQGHAVSESAVGRWAKSLRTIELMKTAGMIVRQTMGNMTAENAPSTQKAAAEVLGSIALNYMVSHEELSSKQMKDVGQTIRDCAQVAINADKYIREQLGRKVEAAARSTRKKLTKAGVNRKLIQEIIDEHLGVVRS